MRLSTHFNTKSTGLPPWMNKDQSVTGIFGGSRISSASANVTSSSFGSSPSYEAGGFSNNGKDTMQNLNDRLAIYLETVRSLEQANSDLEKKIRDYYNKKAAVAGFDPSGYYSTINLLHSQINDATMANTTLVLQIDNAKLAADDLKIKLDTELALKLAAENDNIGLRRALDDLTIKRTDLQKEIEYLKKELIHMKKNHEEELAAAKGHSNGTVNVELDSAPPIDLAKILAEVREQYEGITEKNRQEVEAWHREQCQSLNKEVAVNTEALQTSKTEVTNLKRTVQSLEIELQSLLHMKNALESTLSETEAGYRNQIQRHQALISQVELDLLHVRSDSERHSTEYKQLLDAKTRLELEINNYRSLLDGEDNSFSQEPLVQTQKGVTIISKEQSGSSSTIRKTMTVTEETVDGKVVSSKVEELNYFEFVDVFSKKEANSLPPHKPYDCPIDLYPGAIPP
ncbi:keratin, type I cytoskeletal 47 kDa-like [Rhinophrynus dorsalis]